jgi:hypothetical protein
MKPYPSRTRRRLGAACVVLGRDRGLAFRRRRAGFPRLRCGGLLGGCLFRCGGFRRRLLGGCFRRLRFLGPRARQLSLEVGQFLVAQFEQAALFVDVALQ